MTHIQVILGSTRTGRLGDQVAHWFMEQARQRNDLTFELVDLADWPLPLTLSPRPPAMAESDEPATAAWAEKVGQADGYVFVTPEYNHGYPAALKNALDHVFRPWNGKPVGFVGYGGPSGGIRAVEQLRQVVIELEMIPLRHQVSIFAVYAAFDESGNPRSPEPLGRQAAAVLQELAQATASAAAGRPVQV